MPSRRWYWKLAGLIAGFIVAVVVTAALAIQAPVPGPGGANAPAFAQRAQLHDRLYFGREKAGGGEVSEAEWADFLIDVLAPRLHEGFTVLQGVGAWRDKAGATRYERSFVVEFVHARARDRDDDLRAAIAEYKHRFEQHSVLWVRADVAVSLR